jgi:hypothetical protein
MSSNRSLLFSFIIASVAFLGCEFSDKEEATVAAYVHVPSLQMQTPIDGSQGSNTHQFEDVWVFANNTFIGSYGVPATIPIPVSGDVNLRFEAGVKKSGQEYERIIYPLMKSSSGKMFLTPNVVDTIVPKFQFFENSVFAFIEDYDRIGTKFIINPLYSGQGDTIIRFQGADARESGKNSARVLIRPGSTVFQMYTSDEYTLPGFNQPVFLEMDFNANLQLVIGYYYQEPNQPSSAATEIIRLAPTNGEWRKIYLALNQEIAPRPPNTQFKFYVGLFKSADFVADVRLDNIKLVYLD